MSDKINARLTVTETKNKAGKYHYKIIDNVTNEVMSERKSNRKYVAATHNGCNYFGRLELAQQFAIKNNWATIVCLSEL